MFYQNKLLTAYSLEAGLYTKDARLILHLQVDVPTPGAAKVPTQGPSYYKTRSIHFFANRNHLTMLI